MKSNCNMLLNTLFDCYFCLIEHFSAFDLKPNRTKKCTSLDKKLAHACKYDKNNNRLLDFPKKVLKLNYYIKAEAQLHKATQHTLGLHFYPIEYDSVKVPGAGKLVHYHCRVMILRNSVFFVPLG